MFWFVVVEGVGVETTAGARRPDTGGERVSSHRPPAEHSQRGHGDHWDTGTTDRGAWAMSASAPLSDQDRRRILESLTQEDLQILQEAFTVYDKNHDGTITTKVDISTSCSV